jgi:very-short-patch-repair endonuclease
VSVTEVLAELGGVATWGTLVHRVGRIPLERAVAVGDVVRLARGQYALAQVDDDRKAAAALRAVLGLTSAALHHGWAVKSVPDRPHLFLSRGRHVDPRVGSAHIHRAELRRSDVQDGVTTEEVTLAQCLRGLPFDEALTVADSALRAGVADSVLKRLADHARGPGSAQMRRVAREASSEAANPFESVLRAIALDVAGLNVRPQVVIREPDIVARPDLVDETARIVLEADSFQGHGGRAALSADARRYNLLVVNGWTVLRFSYEHVMTQPSFVRRVLVAAVALTDGMSNRTQARRRPA